MNIITFECPMYYIGHVLCAKGNAMMKDIASYLKQIECGVIDEGSTPLSLFDRLKLDISRICESYPRCNPIELQMMHIDDKYIFFADKKGTDDLVLHIPLLKIYKKIKL